MGLLAGEHWSGNLVFDVTVNKPAKTYINSWFLVANF